MMRLLGAVSILVGLTGDAFGNGRPPGTSTINFRQGMESHIVAGMTFGVVISRDNGATWTWQCERAVGYGGTYDPDYAYSSTGLFATTFDGLTVNRNGCVYEPTSLAPPLPKQKFFSRVTVGPDGAVYAAASDPTDSKIYKSTDGGITFPVSSSPGQLTDWWQSIEVAPSAPEIVYLTGHRLEFGEPRKFLLLRSNDGGQSFVPLPGNATTSPGGIVGMPDSLIEIAGISPTNANLVFARLLLSDNALSDAVYRSTDGGMSWTKIFERAGAVAFVVRANGQLVAGTMSLGSFVSDDNGATWTELTNAPHIGCLTENSAAEVWACTRNYGTPQLPSDDFGIMKTTDLQSWTGVLRFENITAPEPCPSGTVQNETCDAQLWCGLCAQLGCTANRECATTADGAPDQPSSGCCQTSGEGIAGMMVTLGITVSLLLVRRRRKRSRSASIGQVL